MAKKVKITDVQRWLYQGDVDAMRKHWNNTIFQSYRKAQLVEPYFPKTIPNAWCGHHRSGRALAFSMQHDKAVHDAFQGLSTPKRWLEAFLTVCDKHSFALMAVAPELMQHKNAVEMLDLLMREHCDPAQPPHQKPRPLYKVLEDVHEFYKVFQGKYPLTAMAWISSDEFWRTQSPAMALLIRHAAQNAPEDILGAYMIWTLQLSETEYFSYSPNADNIDNYPKRLKQLQTVAERCGLDMSSFEQHVKQCKAVHDGLDVPLTHIAITNYISACHLAKSTVTLDDDISHLFM